MLWKPYRLRKNWQFQEVIQTGRKIANPSFVIFSTTNDLKNCQFGISIPQKLIKTAVERNHYKRQIRNILILHLKEHKDSCQIDNNHSHHDFVIIIRYSYPKNDFTTNQGNLYKLMCKSCYFKLTKKTNNIWREKEKVN